ncbi:MAG: hypothetical protein CMH26_09280 [Micavibrio sp.]|nr:hypothetical protein [Micavibrio sp.]|tara:strand:+ start:64 stop:672 length:609 start_codon:yes stop_codon:yes gene_type:complete
MDRDQIWENFCLASKKFYTETSTTIDLDKGKGGISKTAAKDFAQAAFDLLKADGHIAKVKIEDIKDTRKLTQNLIFSFAAALGDGNQTSFVNNNHESFLNAIDGALSKAISLKAIENEMQAGTSKYKSNFAICAPELLGLPEPLLNLAKKEILNMMPELKKYGATTDNLIIFTNRDEYNAHCAKIDNDTFFTVDYNNDNGPT